MRFPYHALVTLASGAASDPAATFVWSENIGKIISTALLSMVPTFEGRYALTVGHAMGMPMLFTFILAFVCSSIPMPLIFWLFKPVLRWLYKLPWKPIRSFAAWVENKAARKANKTGSFWALFAFVAIPLPGTGVWTGSMIATLLEMDPKKAMPCILAGNLCACTIMALITMGVFHFI